MSRSCLALALLVVSCGGGSVPSTPTRPIPPPVGLLRGDVRDLEAKRPVSRSFGTQLQVLGDLDHDGFDEVLLFDQGIPQLDPAARAAFWLLSSRDWTCRGGDVDLPPTAGRMSAFLLPDQNGDGCLDFAVMEEGLFGFPGGLALYSGADGVKLREIAVEPNEVMRAAWCLPAGTTGVVAWLTCTGQGPTVAVHAEGDPRSRRELSAAPLGLESVERIVSLDAGQTRPEIAFAVIGKGKDRTGSASEVVVLCDSAFDHLRARWDYPADRWVSVVPCRATDGEPLAAILDWQRVLLVRTADGAVKLDIRIDKGALPIESACILPSEAGGSGRLLLGMTGANLSAGRLDEYLLYVAEPTRSIEPGSKGGPHFGSALGVVHAGSSTPLILAVGTDCRMAGCEGGVVLVDPRDGHELGRFSRVSRSQLCLRE